MKKISRILVALTVMVCILATSVITVGAVEKVNWKNSYQLKVQQIENEYKQGKRSIDDLYNLKFYSVQDFDFDGIPELYHALVAKQPNGYKVQEGSEEIYYMKNSKATLGKIEDHETLGLLPPLTSNKTLNDRQWQYAMYKNSTNGVVFVTKSSWVDSKNSGKVIMSELSFDVGTGILSRKVIYQGNHSLGKEPSSPNGYFAVGSASTYSLDKNPDSKMWSWDPPYILAEKVGNSPTPTAPAAKFWKDSYKDFIMNEKYLKTSQKYNSTNLDSMKIMLHDFEGDGTPEIIISNGKSNAADRTFYVYIYKTNKVVYLDELGKGAPEILGINNSLYPGLFAKRESGGAVKGYYYTIKNGKLVEELIYEENSNGSFVKTDNMTLYNVCKQNTKKVKMYSISEIRKLGWNKYLSNSIGNYGLYSDVSLDSWYYDDVFYVTEKGLMGSVTGNKFQPNDNVTRAMFITVLYRLEKEPETTRVKYSDVPNNSWYADAVSWASNNGIVNGVSDDKFAPNNKITREQLSTILYRYVLYKNKNIIPTEYSIKCFIDNSKVSDYAVTSMNWAVDTGLISGTDRLHLTPSGLATRAQTAVILRRLCERYNF